MTDAGLDGIIHPHPVKAFQRVSDPSASHPGYEVGKEIGVLIYDLAQEGQRATVIVGAARLDIALEHPLKRVMAHHPGGSDNLFDPDRPLGTFLAKIALCYRLGLIGSTRPCRLSPR